jgi:hypothetical protein
LFIDTSVFFKSSIAFSLILGSLLCVLNILLHLIKLSIVSTFISYFVLFWIVLAGLILPLSISTGMIDPEDNPIHRFNLILLIFLSVTFSIVSLTKHKKYIIAFILITVVTSVPPSILSIYNSDTLSFTEGPEVQPSLAVSKNKNIWVVSFDGVPGHIVSGVLNENKDLSEELKDFTFFNNVISQAPSTGSSIMGEIYGVQDFNSMGKNRREILANLESSGRQINL